MHVLVTGATGFIAGHCISELLYHGHAVRGTVRNTATADIAHLARMAGERGGTFEVVQASLDSDDGWDAAMLGCDVVWHVASPLPVAQPDDKTELIRPAVEGTLRVLRAADRSSTVRRVVMTSSLDAVTVGHPRDDRREHTEADWTVLDGAPAYAKSKTLAERAAWDFVQDTDLELVTINPGLVLGPVQRGAANASLETVRMLLAHELPLVPRLGFAIADVRDVALAHRLATETPAAAGQRYIVAGEHRWMGEIAAELAGVFAGRGYRVPTRRMPYPLMWLVARFDPTVRRVLPDHGVPALVSTTKARTELGWVHRPARDSVLDAAQSLIDFGIVPRSPADR